MKGGFPAGFADIINNLLKKEEAFLYRLWKVVYPP